MTIWTMTTLSQKPTALGEVLTAVKEKRQGKLSRGVLLCFIRITYTCSADMSSQAVAAVTNSGFRPGPYTEEAEWHQQGSGGRDPGIFLYIFNTKSCILMHSLAPKMGITSVFIKTPMHWGPYQSGHLLPPTLIQEGRLVSE